MYRHLLVPIDGSPLSSATIEKAVEYGRSVGARLTFFHARPDFGVTQDGALMHATAPAAFVDAAAGNAQALLGKAEAAARAGSVICESVIATSDRPHEAIHEAARTQDCDLIFMASHGRRGLKGALLGSVTQKVLSRATLPVLVVAVESNLQATDEQRAIGIIKDEHRSLAAVIHGLQLVSRDAAQRGRPPDFGLLQAMIFYVERFPQGLHHPKEERYLFRRLRERTHVCDTVIDELERQHLAGTERFEELRRRLRAFSNAEAGSSQAFAASVDDFAEDQWRHMRAEEDVVLPAASRYLTATDWAEIANAFTENADPHFSGDSTESFGQLFAHLLNLASQKPAGN